MVSGKLPVSAQTLRHTANLMRQPDIDGWQIHGKTGMGYPKLLDGSLDREQQIGWFVGWASKQDKTLIFVHTVIQKPGKQFASLRAREEVFAALPARLKKSDASNTGAWRRFLSPSPPLHTAPSSLHATPAHSRSTTRRRVMVKQIFTHKIALLLLLCLLMMIPVHAIMELNRERQAYRSQAIHSIMASHSGPQRLMGPVLVQPIPGPSPSSRMANISCARSRSIATCCPRGWTCGPAWR